MRNPLPPAELYRQLALTVPKLQSMTAELDDQGWLAHPIEGEWSITETICHLRDVDREIHLPRLQSIIARKDPFMPGVIADNWVTERNYQAQDGRAALQDLAASREELLAILPPAESPIWQRSGRHTFFGPTTFLELVCLTLEHDILHVGQVEKILYAGART
jgi:uncharacterized damage-inducible protein DinB